MVTTIVGFSLATIFFILFIFSLIVIFYQDWERTKLLKKTQFQNENSDDDDPLAALIDEKEKEITEEERK